MNLSQKSKDEVMRNFRDPIQQQIRTDNFYPPISSSEISLNQEYRDAKNKILNNVNDIIEKKVKEEYEKTEHSMNPFSVAGKIRAAANKNIAPNTLTRQVGKFVNSREEKKKNDFDYIRMYIGLKNYLDFIGQNAEIDSAIIKGKEEIDKLNNEERFKDLTILSNPLAVYVNVKKGGKAKRKTRRVKRKMRKTSKKLTKNKRKTNKRKRQQKTSKRKRKRTEKRILDDVYRYKINLERLKMKD